jgi:hypothetical protein
VTWFSLVPCPRPRCLPLRVRDAELAALADQAAQGTAQQCGTRAAEVLNKAALAASDCGLPGLARDLCRRQYETLAASAPLPGWAAAGSTAGLAVYSAVAYTLPPGTSLGGIWQARTSQSLAEPN